MGKNKCKNFWNKFKKKYFYFKKKSPPKSPDLNPIEMIWADLKYNLRYKLLKNKINIARAINDYKMSLTAEKCRKFINSLKKVF